MSLLLTRFVRFMSEPTPQPEENPYLATEVADISTSVSDRSQPGTVAIVFSVMTGLAVAVLTFVATFFITCLGVISIDNRSNEFGMVLVFGIAGVTTAAAFAFTVWGCLKIARSLKK